MKSGPLLFVCVLITLINSSNQALANLPVDIEKKVELLERRGEYETARAFLRDEYLKTGNMNIFLKWTELDEQIFDTLRRNQNHFAIQQWNAYKHRDNETKSEKAVRWGKYALSVPLDIMGGAGMVSGSNAIGQTEYDRRKEFEYESTHPVRTLSTSQIRDTLNMYKLLKESYFTMMRILDQLMVQANGGNLDEAIELKTAQKEYFEDVAQRRCQFISYDVISPALNRTKQLIFLSESAKILSIGHSMDYLREAVEFMGQGAGDQQLILEAERDVRMEFIEVYRLLKETAGTAEFEELRVFAKLQDKIGEERRLGYQRWMEK
jgi:hypothetical protein